MANKTMCSTENGRLRTKERSESTTEKTITLAVYCPCVIIELDLLIKKMLND